MLLGFCFYNSTWRRPSVAIIRLTKRELVALLLLCSCCHVAVSVLYLFSRCHGLVSLSSGPVLRHLTGSSITTTEIN